MTPEELELLKSSIDEVVLLKTRQDGQVMAQILFVFDAEDTPDVFFVEVEAKADGSFVPREAGGHSVLLADVIGVRRLE